MASGLVALEHIEWQDDAGNTHRIAPGGEVPRDLPGLDDIRAHGSAVGTKAQFDAKQQAEVDDREEAMLRASAAAQGYKLVRSADAGSASDRKA